MRRTDTANRHVVAGLEERGVGAVTQPHMFHGLRRTGWDSNPRYAINVHTLSRRAP